MMKDFCLATCSRLEGHGSMVIVGEWFPCEDGITRPVVEVEVPGADGTLCTERFLVDTAADRTVFSARLRNRLCMLGNGAPPGVSLKGIGGGSPYVLVTTALDSPAKMVAVYESVATSLRSPIPRPRT